MTCAISAIAMSTRAKVDSQEQPTPHDRRGRHPVHLFGTQFGIRLIQLHPLHLEVLHALLVVRHSPLGSHPLEEIDGLEIHSTNVGGPRITDTPPLTVHQLYDMSSRNLL